MDKNTEGRVPIDIIEIDLDYCEHDYGDSSCLADLSVDQNKCFNTLATCGAVDNYSPEVYTYRFCSDQSDIPISDVHYPFLLSASVSPGKINPLGADQSTTTLGKRITLSVSMSDHPATDRYYDKYQSERIIGTAQYSGEGYNPFERSTFWRKFKARNPYYKNRPIRYISGYIENGIVYDEVTQYFIITNISDSDESGRVRIEAKDPLYLAQREKALAPNPSEGYLTANINNSVTSITLSPSGIGATYAASGHIRVESEVMSFTRASDVLTVVRGQYNTIAAAHDADSVVQECLRFDAQLPYQILTTLLEDYAEIDSSYLDTAQWYDESVTKDNLPQAYSALITEPTDVEKLLNEITEQMYFYIWFSSREGLVKIRAVRPIQDDEITELNYDEHIISGTLAVSEDTSKLITRVVVNYAQIDPTKALDDINNYAASEVNVNLAAESENEYRDKRTKIINSRWIGSGSGGAAAELAERYLYRFTKPLRSFGFSLDAKDRDLWLSDFIAIRSPFVVDSIGNEQPITAHIIQAQESKTGSIYTYRAEEYVYYVPDDDGYIELRQVASESNINLREWWDDEFPATPPDAADKIRFVIEQNVVASASSVSEYGIELLAADFPPGCTLLLEIRPNAWVVGKGGAGGAGTNTNGSNGSAGGTAMLIEFPITISNLGVIGGGGGGGGGGAGYNPLSSGGAQVSGGGGGGGAGYAAGGTIGTNATGTAPSGGTNSMYKLSTVGASSVFPYYGAKGTYGNWGMFRFPDTQTIVTSGSGGNGGGFGQNGASGTKSTSQIRHLYTPDEPVINRYNGGTGGVAGKAVNGVSFVTWEIKGDVRGGEIN